MNGMPPLPTTQPKNSALAIWSLVLGIVGLLCLPILAAIPAVICGHMAYSRIKRSGGVLTGQGLAIAGLIMGYLGLVWAIVLIPMLAAIAIPNFVKARETAQRNACINNLRQIDGAKQQWALENKKDESAVPARADLDSFLNGSFSSLQCPQGGTYTINAVGVQPACSIPGHELSAVDWSSPQERLKRL
jgi:competence protein ComGC